MLKQRLFLLYAGGAYVAALVNIAYIVGFLANSLVPKGIGDGEMSSLSAAVTSNAGLVFLFGLHHSITARTAFKQWWTQFVPKPIERSTYLYMTAVMTAVLVIFWQPIPVVIWQVNNVFGVAVIFAAYFTVWAMMLSATFHFGHFRFLGWAQAWDAFRAAPPAEPSMTARHLYALIRHPIRLGWMVTPWLTPELTVGHVVFAVSTLIYVLVATHFEEADLIEDLGDAYRDYQSRVPAFVPEFRITTPSSRRTACESVQSIREEDY